MFQSFLKDTWFALKKLTQEMPSLRIMLVQTFASTAAFLQRGRPKRCWRPLFLIRQLANVFM